MEHNEVKKIKQYFSLMYFILMAARAVFNPFVTVYLQEKGLSTPSIGIIMALNSFVIIISQPFWGIIADRLQSVKKTLVICFIFQGIMIFNLNIVNSFILIAAAYCTSTFFSSPEGPLFDTWIINSLKNTSEEKSFGRIKLWGCLSYSACSVLGGLLIDKYSTRVSVPLYAVLLILIGIAIYFAKLSGEAPKALKFKEMQIGRILRDNLFIAYLIYVFFMQLPHRAGFTFYPVLIDKLGGTKAMVGYTSALMFVSEAAVMYFSKNLLKKIKPEYLIMASAFFFALWQFLYSIVTMPYHIIIIALLDGPSFALFTVGTLYYMSVLAPKELRTTYQTIAHGIYFGLSGIAGNALGGWVIDRFGYKTMFTCGYSLIITVTILYAIFTVYTNRKNETERVSG